MATANGTLTPPTVPGALADHIATKRKHEDEFLDLSNGHQPDPRAQVQRDILEVLRKYDMPRHDEWANTVLTSIRYDTSPSFLHHTFCDNTPSGPSPKKARLLASSDDKISIGAKLADGAYRSFDRLRQDAVQVSESLIQSIRSTESSTDTQAQARPSIDELKRIQRVKAVEELLKNIAAKEEMSGSVPRRNEPTAKAEDGVVANGLVQSHDDVTPMHSGTVLTLFGNAPTPKQLFSSLQTAQGQEQAPPIKTELPIEEMSLPNGLTATKIIPSATARVKSGPTIAEAFAPSNLLPQLSPPKSHKRANTRDNTIKWELKETSSRGSKRGGYTTQSLTVADWLGYGGVDPIQDPSSPREKRKLRDRALSSGGDSVQTAPTKAILEAELERQEEALFRRAYSSYAPSHDNSRSLVSAEVKNLVWWHKVGNRQFNERFAIDPALRDESSMAPVSFPIAADEPDKGDVEDEDFGKAVDDFKELDESAFEETKTDLTDVQQVLRKISELLETLASQQRVRHASLPPSASATRTPISPAPLLAAKIGKPDAPAEDEKETYGEVRREIAYLVLQLPPYAVAKLDGDQLAELGVSKLVMFKSSDYRGQLEEDQIARLSRYTAATTAAGVASLARSSSAINPHYSSSARTPAIGQAANTRYGQTAGHGTGRAPATAPAYPRPTSNQSNHGTPTGAPRSQYAQPNQYTRPGAPQQQSYGQTNGQQNYQQRQQPTTGGYGSYGQTFGPGSSQAQQRPTYSSSQPLQQFQQRAHTAFTNAAAYQSNAQTSINRNASPANPAIYSASPQPAGVGLQARPPYPSTVPSPQPYAQQQPASGRATPVNYASPAHTPVNGVQQLRAPPPLVPRATSGTPQPPAQNRAPPQGQQGMANGHA